MVEHKLKSKTKTVNRFNRFSKFILIGNKIDGYVSSSGNIEFNNYEEVKLQLPKIIKELEFGGEWRLTLYQVPHKYSIRHL